MKPRLLIILLIAAMALATPRPALALRLPAASDSIATLPSPPQYSFRWQQLALPVGLMAAGAAGIGAKWGGCSLHSGVAADVLQFAPGLTYMALGTLYRGGRGNGLLRRTLAATTGVALTVGFTCAVKAVVHEQRPNDPANHHSFPSGHTARAFLGAELTRIEYGTWPGIAAYAAASAVGVLRVCSGRHWLNDVVAGAGIGIICARAAYWLLPLEEKLLGLHATPRTGLWVVAPSYSPEARAPGLTALVIF